MDDQTLIMLYEDVKAKDDNVAWANHIVLVLVEEIIRLRNKHEGLGYELD